MKKKLISLALALTAICTSTAVLAEYSFTDIGEEQYSWCAPQIEEMNEAGYINGYPDGTYRPDNQVTKLECIALFARAMGSGNEANDDILALAHEKYDSAIKSSSLSWGEDEIVYMMYKDALTAADLTTYINGDAKNLPMTRGEAAVIITKAMGGEEEAKSVTSVSLPYTDAREIPSNILQYVKYVTDKEIMNGIDDAFSANGTVTRSQIAVMLSRVIEKCDYSFDKARINDINEKESIITYTVDGEEHSFKYTVDTDFYIKGEKVPASSIPGNVAAVVQMSGDDVVAFYAMSDQSDEEISVVFMGYNSSSTITKINVKDSESSEYVRTFTCANDVPVTYQGSPATLKALKAGDSVVLTLSDGKVQAISAVEKTIEIKNATVEAIDVDDENVTITISHEKSEYDGKTYFVSDTVSVTKNNKDSDLRSIYVGDSVSLVLKYGEVTSITAKATSNTVEGVLTGISIGNTTKITMTVNGQEKEYVVPIGCEIEKNGEKVDIYDLKLDDTLRVTVESGTITKIKSIASQTISSGKVSGVVSAVNTSFKFVAVTTENSTVPINVYVNTSTKFTVVRGSSSGASLSTLKVGDKVDCYVTANNGAYVASDIVIEKAN